ncbi:hypothetical protein SARC_08514 [Sphaeroforma arctica JP610]|uniref:Transcription initiation factor TFIID subunit 13 n=1 Tax=Sphaeroforma arctica JP610 TaxID=667725 RepID=A0A0L0FQN0_9EUKA|nr:hypothetical protein SARC_08514 [Sphaeroforma arctica JP610]KNC79082.1 hypothetical protein SARC_08514 [Sphaeroforma arctica JP610]|eukprot:XP_014152984.1 hypothetical protein SARC_08514 [Sphaeroforma arctica JP610]
MFGARRRSSRIRERNGSSTVNPEYEELTPRPCRQQRHPCTRNTRGIKKHAVKNSQADAAAENRRELDAMLIEGQCKNERKPVFLKEVRHMMFGFGDSNRPLHASCKLMEEILFEFMQDLLADAQKVSTNGPFRTEDLCFVIHRDKKKLNRAQELLVADKEISEAKRVISHI